MYQINKGRRTQAAQEPVIFKYSDLKRSALYLGVIFAGTVFAACHSAPVHRSGSGVENTTHVLAPGQQKTPLDSVIQFLVWSLLLILMPTDHRTLSTIVMCVWDML